IERFAGGIERSKGGDRFTRREDTTTHVAFRTGMLSRSYKPVEDLIPILHGLVIHLHNDISDNRRANSFVRKGKVNVRRVAAVEFEDGPDRGAHLLPLHISGVTGNEERADSDERRNDRAIAERFARFLLFCHNGDCNYFQVIAKSFVSRAIFCAIERRFSAFRRLSAWPLRHLKSATRW